MNFTLEQRGDGKWVMHGDGFSRPATAPEIALHQQLERYREAVRSALADLEAMGIK